MGYEFEKTHNGWVMNLKKLIMDKENQKIRLTVGKEYANYFISITTIF